MQRIENGEKVLKNHHQCSSTVSEYTSMNFMFNGFSKLRIIKNLLVLSLAFLTLCGAYDGLILFQSTLNGDEDIGVLSVAVQFGCGCIISLFFPKYLIKKLGSQKVMLISMLMFIPYIGANFYPHWSFMMPASILVGSWYPLLFSALCAYLNNLSILYTEHRKMGALKWRTLHQYAYDNDAFYSNESKKESNQFEKKESNQFEKKESNQFEKTEPNQIEKESNQIEKDSNQIEKKESKSYESIINDFSEESTFEWYKGICNPKDKHCAKENIQNSTGAQVQNLEDSRIFSYTNATTKILESTTAQFFGFHGMIYQSGHVWTNLMSYYVLRSDTVGNEHSLNSTCVCGAGFCADQTECYENNEQIPSFEMRNILISVFLALGIFSVLLIALFLDNVESKKEDISLSVEVLMATFKQMKNINQLCVIPLSIYIGIIEGFLMCEYPQAYVACSWGIQQIGLVAAVFSVTLALASSVSAWFVKYTGRLAIFLFTAALNVAMAIILLLWTPDSERPAMIFAVGGIIGVVSGIFWTQLRAFYCTLFKGDEEAGFANYQLWRSIGSCIAFAYSSYLCTAVKVYLLLVFSTMGIIGIICAEFNHSRNERKY